MNKVNFKILNSYNDKLVILKNKKIIDCIDTDYFGKVSIYLDKGVYNLIIKNKNMCITFYVIKDMNIDIVLKNRKRYLIRLTDRNYLNLPIEKGMIRFE